MSQADAQCNGNPIAQTRRHRPEHAAKETHHEVWKLTERQHCSSLLQEHFKECEKEAKLKPFAKAALASKNERIDPILQAKEEAQRWLRDSVNCLSEQVEGFEVNPCC